jgi:hypothetical protein
LSEGRLVALGAPDELRAQIGGDTITIETGEAARLAEEIRQRFGLTGHAIDGAVRLEAADGATWIARLMEALRFVRQRNRIVASIGTPLVFWLLFGAGLAGSFRVGEGDSQQNFLTYFFPGSLLLIVLFSSIFSAISIIEDRRDGFLQ